jgi:hypothetical protein
MDYKERSTVWKTDHVLAVCDSITRASGLEYIFTRKCPLPLYPPSLLPRMPHRLLAEVAGHGEVAIAPSGCHDLTVRLEDDSECFLKTVTETRGHQAVPAETRIERAVRVVAS